jgi:hypothetical protein
MERAMTQPKPLPRLVQPRLWTGLALAGATLGLAAVPLRADSADLVIPGGPEQLWMAQSEGGEGGEGGAAVVDDDGQALSLVAQLGLIEGALRAGSDLAQAGQAEAAAAHVADLIKDNYDPAEAAMGTAKAPAFETELTAAISAITEGKTAEDVRLAADAALAGIAAARAVEAGEPKEWFDAILFLTRKAGEEYGKGVKDGTLTDAGEYQESWGNILAARTLAAELSQSADASVKAAADAATASLDEVSAAYGGILGDGPLSGDESLFASAAAKIELESYKVK